MKCFRALGTCNWIKNKKKSYLLFNNKCRNMIYECFRSSGNIKRDQVHVINFQCSSFEVSHKITGTLIDNFIRQTFFCPSDSIHHPQFFCNCIQIFLWKRLAILRFFFENVWEYRPTNVDNFGEKRMTKNWLKCTWLPTIHQHFSQLLKTYKCQNDPFL